MLSILCAALAALPAPITHVTVYSDRARVVRTAKLTLSGSTQSVELPILPAQVDLKSIRLEAQGGEVKHFDLKKLDDEQLPPDEAKQAALALEAMDDQLAQNAAEREAVRAQLSSLSGIVPSVPTADPLHPTPRLSAQGWDKALAFVSEQTQKLTARQEALEVQARELSDKRVPLWQNAAKLNARVRRQGVQVTAQLAGNGPVTLELSYVALQARWYPLYDLTLDPVTSKVQVAFSGNVSQETGEDWSDAQLVLSTAIPATAVSVPKVATWKIGQKERFIPAVAHMNEMIPPPPGMQVETAKKVAARTPTPTPDKSGVNVGQDFAKKLALIRPGSNPDETRSYESLATAPADENQPASGGAYSTPPSQPAPGRPPTVDVGSTTTGVVRSEPVAKEMRRKQKIDFADQEVNGDLVRPDSTAAPVAYATEASETISVSGRSSARAMPTSPFSLTPPSGYAMPQLASDLPAMAAGGYDLAFPSLQKESLQSGKGARRVALFAQSWPVTVERKVYPAEFDEAFLVAELKSPSKQPLPAGVASLFVGDDPAGEAKLALVSPGEAFTLPLGIDRALKPKRNVKVVETEKGLISKDEISRYEVTIELANPYRTPLAVRVLDQAPVADGKDVEVEVLDSKPGAAYDKPLGKLEWRTTLPPQKTSTFSFVYTIKKPKGWRMGQREVRP